MIAFIGQINRLWTKQFIAFIAVSEESEIVFSDLIEEGRTDSE
jgi:hypothetical protein